MRYVCTLVLLAGLIALVPAGPGTARAEDPDRVVIDLTYLVEMYPTSDPVGTFTLSGTYEDSGTCTQKSTVTNADGSFTSVHTLAGSDGTIEVRLDIGAAYYGYWYTARRLGTFTVLSGTGGYASLEGGGETLATITTGSGWGVGWGIPSTTYTQTVFHLDSDPPANVAPTATLMASPVNSVGTLPYTYSLYVGAWDADGMPVKFEWDVDGNGTWDVETTSAWLTHTYPGVGTYDPVVRVTDNDGASTTATVQIVISTPPTVTITSPTNGSTVSGTVTFSASVTNALSVSFHVDGAPVGTATGSALVPWTGGVAWNTATVANGTHTLTATALGLSMVTATTSIQVTVANTTPPPPPTVPVTITAIAPSTMKAGTTIQVTVTGTGFLPGASLSFANGSGPTPTASATTVAGTTRITATVSVSRKKAKKVAVWDVVVRNANGQSGTLPGGFTVTK